jgi:predicted nucleic acid-binding protein
LRALLDTTVLVAALVKAHPRHASAFLWLEAGNTRKFTMVVSSHTLAELYAFLTTNKGKHFDEPLAPSSAASLLQTNLAAAEIVDLSKGDYYQTIQHIARLDLAGAIVYDAIIVKAARKAAVDRLVTNNVKHFARIWPDAGAEVIVTSDVPPPS